MSYKLKRILRGELRKTASMVNFSSAPSLMPSNYWHIYIKLEFKKQYENAETKQDGKSFVRNVMRAATATEEAIAESDGIVVEVQGSTVHCILPDNEINIEHARNICHTIHTALHAVFNESSKVEGWRMAMDWGKTLLVRGRGIHNDDSYVSLGNSANAPAKHLFGQLTLPSEGDRNLKRYMLAWKAGKHDSWKHENLLRKIPEMIEKSASSRYLEIKTLNFSVESVLTKQAQAAQEVRAQAAPLDAKNGNQNLNINETVVYFGWVMRADIDGFTARVEKCFDNDEALLELGEKFQSIMDQAAQFALEHDEILVQLPWAGDNFTAAVVFDSPENYRDAIEEKLVGFALDFLDSLEGTVNQAHFGGWAQTIAGGNVHGNAEGNIYVGAVNFDNRRFLIGTGVGMGRSTQAFTDMNPSASEIVIFNEDYERLLNPYKEKLSVKIKADGSQSTIFRKGESKDLREAKLKIEKALLRASEPAKTLLTVPSLGSVVATNRDYGQTSN